MNKALPIAEALYPGYSLLFLFDNATNHSVYADNALRIGNMNKRLGGKQPGYKINGLKKMEFKLSIQCYFKTEMVITYRKKYNVF